MNHGFKKLAFVFFLFLPLVLTSQDNPSNDKEKPDSVIKTETDDKKIVGPGSDKVETTGSEKKPEKEAEKLQAEIRKVEPPVKKEQPPIKKEILPPAVKYPVIKENTADEEAFLESHLFTLNNSDLKYARIPGYKSAGRTPSKGEIEDINTGISEDSKKSPEEGFFGLSKKWADFLAKFFFILLIIVIIILYRIRSRSSDSGIHRSIFKK